MYIRRFCFVKHIFKGKIIFYLIVEAQCMDLCNGGVPWASQQGSVDFVPLQPGLTCQFIRLQPAIRVDPAQQEVVR